MSHIVPLAEAAARIGVKPHVLVAALKRALPERHYVTIRGRAHLDAEVVQRLAEEYAPAPEEQG
ncbi:hypothetical protein ABZ767_18490 [Streptomyces pseudogriseolus]|uniref:hypothetical protein n=1 Tax=Streptomyces pseudogriseolus TaxID=36817 RepID=UPI00347EC071